MANLREPKVIHSEARKALPRNICSETHIYHNRFKTRNANRCDVMNTKNRTVVFNLEMRIDAIPSVSLENTDTRNFRRKPLAVPRELFQKRFLFFRTIVLNLEMRIDAMLWTQTSNLLSLFHVDTLCYTWKNQTLLVPIALPFLSNNRFKPRNANRCDVMNTNK